MIIDPAWEGSVQFYELVFGTWLSYAFLAFIWERVLRCPLVEWKYVLITFLGASAYWINHYFQNAPFWSWMLNVYTLSFISVYYFLAVHGQPRPLSWRIGATLTAIAFSVAFIIFENLSRCTVNGFGISEFWFMLFAFFGFCGVILWRGPLAPAYFKAISGQPITPAWWIGAIIFSILTGIAFVAFENRSQCEAPPGGIGNWWITLLALTGCVALIEWRRQRAAR